MGFALKDSPRLEDFANDSKRPSLMWCDRLPVDIQEQIVTTDCTARVAARWLLGLGYEDVTDQKVDVWRRKKRLERGWEPGSK